MTPRDYDEYAVVRGGARPIATNKCEMTGKSTRKAV
jgi:hypothetical protein